MALPHLRNTVKFTDVNYADLAKMTQSRVTFVKDCAELLDFIDELPRYDIELFTHKKMKTNPEVAALALEATLKEFSKLKKWTHDEISASITKVAEENELKNGQILWSIRTALSGKPTTPCGATELCELFGKNETLRRMDIGLLKLR